MRRAVRAGDGWYPGSNNPQFRLDTPERLGTAVAELRQTAEAAGRDPGSIDIAYVVFWPVDWTAQTASDGARRTLTGSPQAMVDDVAALKRAGVRHLCLTFQTPSLNDTLGRIQRFAEEVMPLIK
jgi:alkanesulfonate monooxygenase SsuD/methylene tetrahydromethanopterin reductase-like flavin-dependent oxidoreductase (luciferase family)